MTQKEAKARIKINKLLEEAGWRFFDSKEGKANIHLESNVKVEDLGDNFENKINFWSNQYKRNSRKRGGIS
jgi:type I restriction enzyme, R subunit